MTPDDEIHRLRTALAASEAKLGRAREALRPFAEIFTGELDANIQLPTVRPVKAFRAAATTLKDIT
jgi:hypothetical protein